MSRINLLPWREELRKQFLKEFLISIGVAAAVTVVVLFGVHLYIEDLKDYQNSRNRLLQKEIARLNITINEIKDIENRKNQLLAKIEVIYGLQLSRPRIVHLFEEMAETTPDGVYLTKFTQSGMALTINGKSQSNARVSAYMRAIEASPWLQEPSLNIIRAGEGQGGHSDDFILRTTQRSTALKKKNQPQDSQGGR